jgi:hypothetical protein
MFVQYPFNDRTTLQKFYRLRNGRRAHGGSNDTSTFSQPRTAIVCTSGWMSAPSKLLQRGQAKQRSYTYKVERVGGGDEGCDRERINVWDRVVF